jgi:hypothetical protein
MPWRDVLCDRCGNPVAVRTEDAHTSVVCSFCHAQDSVQAHTDESVIPQVHYVSDVDGGTSGESLT